MIGKGFFRRILALVVAGVFALVPATASALSASQLNMFSQNNILFYDPTGGGISCYSGNLSGDTIMAKVVNYLSGNNPSGFVLSENGIAGILANFQGESGFNPFRYQSDSADGPGYGIAQFTPKSKIWEPLRTDPRTASYYNEYIDVKYTYYDSETGLPKEPVPMEVVDAWLSVQLDFFFGPSSEFENTKVGSYRNKGGTMGLDYISSDMTAHEAMDAAKTPEDATRIFVWIMERPADKPGASNRRSANAQKWLSYVRSMSVVGGGMGDAGGATVDGSKVTVIGDSITVEARDSGALAAALPGATVNAEVGRQFSAGIPILQEMTSNGTLGNTVVFALGTNGNFTLEQAQQVVDIAGSERKVVFVTNYTTSNDYTANNNVITKVKNDNSNVYIADWKGAVEGQEGTYLGGDGVHPTAAGQELFADIIASTVGSSKSAMEICVEGAVNGGLSESQAQRLADYYNSSAVDASTLVLGRKDNCVSFSGWFVNYFTDIAASGWPNGKDVANHAAQAGGLQTGNEPRPYALFSTTSGDLVCSDGYICGHTGIVVGVDGDDLITVEAAYGAYSARVFHRKASELVNDKYGFVFTYLDPVINQSTLADVVGN